MRTTNYLIDDHFISGEYFQSTKIENQIKIRNLSKFSLQIKEFRDILSVEKERVGCNNIKIDIQEEKYLNMNILDLILYFYYKGYVNINNIILTTTINFDVNITEKLLGLINKDILSQEHNLKDKDIIQIGKDIYFNEERKQIIYEKKIINIGNADYEIFTLILLKKIGTLCKYEYLKNEFDIHYKLINKPHKKFQKTDKSNIGELLNNKYSYIKKANNKLNFMHKYIILHEGEGYEIKKYVN